MSVYPLTDEQSEDAFRWLFENGYLIQTGPDDWATTPRAEAVFKVLATALLIDEGGDEMRVGPFFVARVE